MVVEFHSYFTLIFCVNLDFTANKTELLFW